MDRRRATLTSCLATLLLAPMALLGGCSGEPAADESSNSPTTDASSSADTENDDSSSAAADNDAAGRPPRIDKLDDGPLEPGRYALPTLGPEHHLVAIVDIPGGYTHWGPFLNAAEPQEPDDPLAISLWVVTGVYKDACKGTTQIPAGDSVRSLADAFLQQKVTSVAKPRPVTLAGFDGLYLEITAPTKFNLSHCNEAEFNFWESTPAGARWTRMPGMRDRLWILDVDGQPAVLAMFVPPSATDEQIDEFTDIVKRARFVEA